MRSEPAESIVGPRKLHRDRLVADAEHARNQKRLASADPGQQVDNWEDHAQDRPQQGQKTAKPPQQPTRHLSFPANYARDQV
jgi:hypothetical protein